MHSPFTVRAAVAGTVESTVGRTVWGTVRGHSGVKSGVQVSVDGHIPPWTIDAINALTPSLLKSSLVDIWRSSLVPLVTSSLCTLPDIRNKQLIKLG